jgi:aminoglycoside phosphotransferase (APT) family kinase protein
MTWRSAPEEYGGLLGLDLAALGMPGEEEFIARYYAARTTPAPALARFHMAFSQFRFAVILEGIAARARSGTAASADALAVGELSKAYARRGVATIEG